MGSLTGKTAVVLGASGDKNFGSAAARRLAEEGANVVVAARREAPLQKLAEEIGGLAVACDLTQESQQEQLFQAALDAYGRVDIALYSAGVHAACPIAEITAEEIRPSLEVSFVGALLFFKHAAAAMKEGGSVITVSSLTARLPGPGLAAYAGARAGIDYALRIAAQEYGPAGVRFNSIAAGLIETDMTGGFFQMDSVIKNHIAATPVGRMGTVEDFAEAVVFLADSKKSGYVNGQLLDLSGGQHMGSLPSY